MREPKENEKDNDSEFWLFQIWVDDDKMVLMMKKKGVFNFILIIIKIFYKIGIYNIYNINDSSFWCIHFIMPKLSFTHFKFTTN
jgi:hypothetical protein